MSTPKLNAALCKAQLALKNPKFDAVNPHFRSKFASLKSVREAVVPVFAEHGIAVIQDLQTIEGCAAVYTHLLHESGEEKTYGPFVVPKTKNDAQGLASASTYARRYHLQAVGCIVGEEDDDGNAASEPAKEKKMPEEQAAKIAELLDGADLESGEGIAAFAEAWIELDQGEQLGFAPWITNYWPGGVSKAKQKMRDAMQIYRTSNEEAA